MAVRKPSDFDGKQEWKIMKGKARAMHEAWSGQWKMKEFAILCSVYRGNRDHHHMVFEAVDCIVQSEIMSGRATFDVSYYVVRQVEW